MANRVYVYSSNKIPTKDSSIKSDRAKGIIEYNYNRCLAIDCFCGAKTVKVASSLIWPKSTSIVSDFKEGMDLFIAVYTNLIKFKMFGINQKYLSEWVSFLVKQKGKFFITEFSELGDMKCNSIKCIVTENNNEHYFAHSNAMELDKINKKLSGEKFSILNQEKQFKQYFTHTSKDEVTPYFSPHLYYS